MKKIKKVDPKAAQSVFSFACPCLGTCNTCLSCGCSGSAEASQDAFAGGKAAISLIEQAGTQTAFYHY